MKGNKTVEYAFDKVSGTVKVVTRSIWKPISAILRVLLVSVSMFIVLYFLLSLVISTDTESRLRRENRMYEKLYAPLRHSEQQLGDVIAGLQYKDDKIYGEVFHATAPTADPGNFLDAFSGSDSIPDSRLVSYTWRKSERLIRTAADVDRSFDRILRRLATPSAVVPPMELPLKGISYPQIGASVGKKMNPFYKAEVEHRGIDIIAPRGESVYAPAKGVVSNVTVSRKGEGKSISITHPGGYVTRYTHFSEVFVRSGQTIAKGQKIGAVGMSGTAFAPHLHYEIIKDTIPRNPVHYFFASVTPEEYANMLYMSVNTIQSMD